MNNARIRSVIAIAAIAMAASTPVCASRSHRQAPPAQVSSYTQKDAQADESAWRSLLPAVSGIPVFELDYAGSKVYTLDAKAKETLIASGWDYKGPVFYSCDAEGAVPVYRLHDPWLHFIYSLSDSVPGYTLDGPAFLVQNAATTWQTVTLDADKTSTFHVHNGQSVIINLNGHNITPESGPAVLIDKGGTVTINGNGNLTAAGSDPVVRNNGCAVLNGGHYENNGNYCIINHGNMIINGGEYTHSDRDCVSSLIATGYYNYYSCNSGIGYVAGVNISSPMLTINGGNFHGGRWLLKSDDNGRGFINGGNFYDAKYSVIKNWSTLELIGGTYTARENGEAYGLITNGHVQSDGTRGDVDPGALDIYGGTYNPGAFIFYPGNNGDGRSLVYGNITVHKMDVTGNAALINETWPIVSNCNYNQILGIENIKYLSKSPVNQPPLKTSGNAENSEN